MFQSRHLVMIEIGSLLKNVSCYSFPLGCTAVPVQIDNNIILFSPKSYYSYTLITTYLVVLFILERVEVNNLLTVIIL